MTTYWYCYYALPLPAVMLSLEDERGNRDKAHNGLWEHNRLEIRWISQYLDQILQVHSHTEHCPFIHFQCCKFCPSLKASIIVELRVQGFILLCFLTPNCWYCTTVCDWIISCHLVVFVVPIIYRPDHQIFSDITVSVFYVPHPLSLLSFGSDLFLSSCSVYCKHEPLLNWKMISVNVQLCFKRHNIMYATSAM